MQLHAGCSAHLLSLLLCSIQFYLAKSDKVAIFVPALSQSQLLFNVRIAEELSKDHEVLLIRPDFNPNVTEPVFINGKIRELRCKGTEPEVFQRFTHLDNKFNFVDASFSDALELTHNFQLIFERACYNMVNDDDFLFTLKRENIDFALYHHMDACGLGIIHHLGIPQWGWTMSAPMYRTIMTRLGIPMLPSIYPGILMDSTNEMTFMSRFKNFAWEVFLDFFLPMSTKTPSKILIDKFGADIPQLDVLAHNGKFVVLNSDQTIEYALPVTEKVIFIGGLGTAEPKPLPTIYSEIMKAAKKVVYISFGTVASAESMPDKWKEAFVELFRLNADIQFIWKYDGDIEVPKNVLLAKWVPQGDLLANAKMSAFITHGGYNSLADAITAAVPLLVIPLRADQFRNSRLVEYRHFGIRLGKMEVTAEKLHSSLTRLLSESTFSESVAELQSIHLGHPSTPGSRLRHAVNFTLSHPHYNRDLPHLPLIQLYCLDSIALLLSLLFLFFYMIYRIGYCYYWSCCLMAYKEKVKLQ